MSKKNVLLVLAILAIGLTSLGYYIDSDPPYANAWHTVIEFSIISMVLFSLFSGFYLLVHRLAKN